MTATNGNDYDNNKDGVSALFNALHSLNPSFASVLHGQLTSALLTLHSPYQRWGLLVNLYPKGCWGNNSIGANDAAGGGLLPPAQSS
jgi:hypothetical protein